MADSPHSAGQYKILGSVLVTGGCGFLGSHIVSLLLERCPLPQTRISVVDLRISLNTYPGAQYHTANITDAAAVRSVLQTVKPDIVIHTASPVFAGGAGHGDKKAQQLMHKVNVEGTRVLLDESKRAGVRAFVYTSSASVVSDTIKNLVNADERWSLVMGKAQPEYYSDTKAQAEQLVISSNDPSPSAPFLTTAIRPSAMFGERDVQMIPPMLDVLRTGRTRFQLGNNDNLFDFTYVGNTAHAHVLAAARLLETAEGTTKNIKQSHGNTDDSASGSEKSSQKAHFEDTKVDGEVFIITNEAPIYFWDFPRTLWWAYYNHTTASIKAYSSISSGTSSAARLPLPPSTSTTVLPFAIALPLAQLTVWIYWIFRLGKPKMAPASIRISCMTRYFNTTKARQRLDYTPLWSLEEGIQKTVEWFFEREREESLEKKKV